jgi:hypothetical protein
VSGPAETEPRLICTRRSKTITKTRPRTPERPMSALTTRTVLTAALFLGCALTISGADVVILKDGFVIQGHVSKETTTIVDKASGIPVQIQKSNGFDMINEGAKFTIFSTHAKQLGAISPDTKLRPEYKGYRMPFPGFKAQNPLPTGGETIKTSDFNTKWVRQLTIKVAGGAPETVDQQITFMDPYYIYMVSATHRWRLTYRTTEWDPKLIRKLLSTHPELAEPTGTCDPMKRVLIGKFMLDAGWTQLARDEMDRLKRDFTGTMKKEAQEQYDKLLVEIDQTTAEQQVREAELALNAGRYKYTAELLAEFKEKTATAKDVARAAKVSADLKMGQERYEFGRRMLRQVIDEATGMRPVNALTAFGSGLAVATWKQPAATPGLTLDLAAAAEQVFAELHPDSANRIDTFVMLARQSEEQRAAGKEQTMTVEKMLATAVSGWAKGKNGATTNPDSAWKLWSARELVLAYQRGETMNERTTVLGRYKKNISLAPDELAQMISLLPPADPENLLERTGTQVRLGKVVETGIYRRDTLPVQGHPAGLKYLVKLPPEYHHGRAYPALIVLTSAGLNPEDVLLPLIAEADRNGYILIVPEWTDAFGKGWEWRGEDHVYVTAALRDAVRHFTIDNDRVFMTGVAEGANMAMDVGMSHPDLFAGVIPMGPIPKWNGLFISYWANAQMLPFYVVTGEQLGSGMESLRRMYEMWMPRGFPALWTIYAGRGVEWYSAEAPVMFDWMNRKTRGTPMGTLKLDTRLRQEWQMLRPTDTRFFWLQADDIAPGKSGGGVVPATIQGDIRGNNLLDIQCKRVNHVTLWLTADMINWDNDVKVQVNGSLPINWKRSKKIDQNLEVLLEDYYDRGDRRMLFLNKIDFDTRNQK